MPQKRVPKFILGYGKSYSLLSNASNVDTAIIFVHGFGGKPTSTWRDFHGLADEYSPEYPWWTTCDMFFYSYESVRTLIGNNAELLNNFVEFVWHDDWRGNDPAFPKRKYKELILVGHSEGGVLIRQLVLNRYYLLKEKVQAANPTSKQRALKTALARELHSDFVLASYLRLFAPACRGTNFSSWVGFLTSLSHFAAAVTSISAVRNELHPNSPILESLKVGTEKAHAQFPEIRSLYTRPLFGTRDQIVFAGSYEGERPLWDQGADHFRVCKPSYLHKHPLGFVRK